VKPRWKQSNQAKKQRRNIRGCGGEPGVCTSEGDLTAEQRRGEVKTLVLRKPGFNLKNWKGQDNDGAKGRTGKLDTSKKHNRTRPITPNQDGAVLEETSDNQ